MKPANVANGIQSLRSIAIISCLWFGAAGNAVANDSWPEYGSSRQWSSTLSPAGELTTGNLPAPRLEWTINVGEGRAQIIGDSEKIFIASASKGNTTSAKSGSSIRNWIRCLETSTGKERWQIELESHLHRKEQETFGNQSACPQATPLLIDGRLVAIDFAGVMVCLDANSGKQLWKKDLVADVGAVPVQFGFASSPIRVPGTTDLLVLAAGPNGGLHRMSSKTGEIQWTARSKSFSYATPILAQLNDTRQCIIVSEQRVCGIAISNGRKLWSYYLPKPGLTNVPTPLPVSSNRVLLSGQGCGGTCCIKLEKQADGAYRATEVWSQPKVQLFYTNWMAIDDEYVIGCTDGFLALIRVQNGSIAGRWRGFSDGNLFRLNQRLVLVGGKGAMSFLQFPSKGDALLETARFQLEKGRYWTPATVVGRHCLLRTDDRLTCYAFGPSDARTAGQLTSELEAPKRLAINSLQQVAAADPVEAIFTTFEQKGQQAALELYSRLRAGNKLDADHRLALAAAAGGQQLFKLQSMILQHAAVDLPDNREIAKALAEL
ncbi:MAG: PQQ-binding-like beta-propeller repeat protein [Aureliella sp.]